MALVLCAWLPVVVAAEERRLSLSECVRLALENNPAVVSLEWQLRAADAARARAVAERRPRSDLNLDVTTSDRAQRVAPPSYFGERIFTDEELLVAEVRFTAPVYRGGELANRELVAEKRTSGARATLTTGRQQLVLSVVDAYTRILEQRARVRALEASVAALDANRSVVATLEEIGRVAHLDRLKVDVRLASLQQELGTAQRDLENLGTTLARLLGRKPGGLGLVVADDAPQIPVPDAGSQQLVDRALARSPELAEARSRVEQLAAEMAVVKAEGRPRVEAVAAYSFRSGIPWSSQDDMSRRVDYAWGALTASVPLWTAGRVRAAVAEARAGVSAAEAEVADLELLLHEQVHRAVANLSEARSRREVARVAVREAQAALTVEESTYSVGRSTVNDVLDAQSALLGAQLDRARAEADVTRSAAELLYAVGTDLEGAITIGRGAEEKGGES